MTAPLNSHQARDPVGKWYAAATVRNSDRIIVPKSTAGEYVFPRSRQLLSTHPIVIDKGEETVNFVLAQSAYKYMYEIGLLETRFVIDCALSIANNQLPLANEATKREALTILIDEGYHAYVALDFIIQMKAETGVMPVEVPSSNGNLDAVRRAFAKLPREIHNDFQLVSVCLAEHTLTKDLLAIGREKETTRSFTQVMTDHVSDEGRHAHYFAKLMKEHWAVLPETTKSSIGLLLPTYLDDYLAGDEERSFDRKVLSAAGFATAEAEQVIEDTQPAYVDALDSYVRITKANLVKLLQRTGVLDHGPTRAAFLSHGMKLSE